MAKIGEMVTPTGRLVIRPGDLHTEAWLNARRWRNPRDLLTDEEAGQIALAAEGDPTEAVRRYGYRIGSSDVPSILDLPHVDTPAHVYRAKVYDIRPEPNEYMAWGSIFEEPIAMEWARRNRVVLDEIGLVARDGAPWHQSTIDRRVRECPVYPDRKGECGLEVKLMEFASASRWHVDLPDRIMAQIAHQLYVTGYHHMHYAAKVPGAMRQGIVYREREQKLIDYVVGEVNRFRDEHLLTGIEPDWSEGKADKMIDLDNATHPERDGVVELDLNGIGGVQAYAEAAAEESAAKARKKKLAARLRQLTNGAAVALFAGQRAFWYGEGGRFDTDLDLLKERWPDAYDACVTENRWPVLHIDKAYKARGEK